jgi:signal transduction histidine kinase
MRKIFTRIFLSNAVVGLFSFAVISIIFFFLIRNALIERTLDQLEAVNALKAKQIDNYLRSNTDFSTIQQMLLENTGMGSTGESYIVGPDKKLVSASRFFPNRPPNTIEIDTPLTGPDHTRTDYRGKKVISFSRQLENPTSKWTIVSEIDFDEAMEPVVRFRNYVIVVTVVCLALIVILSMRQYNEREIQVVRERAAALMEGQEEERKRLTLELHDGIGQLLTVIRLQVDASEIDASQRREIIDRINDAIAEIKRISYNVMPGSLVDFGLEPALKGLCDNTARYSNLKVDFRYVRESNHDLNFDVTTAVFRIVQEGINNILKHASAKTVELHVVDKEDSIYVLLKDDGKGFDKEKVNAGLGLRSMSERAKLLRGTADVHSEMEGTVVEVQIPLADRTE